MKQQPPLTSVLCRIGQRRLADSAPPKGEEGARLLRGTPHRNPLVRTPVRNAERLVQLGSPQGEEGREKHVFLRNEPDLFYSKIVPIQLSQNWLHGRPFGFPIRFVFCENH